MSTFLPDSSAAHPLSRADLVAGFHAAGKPRSQWRIGAEFETHCLHRHDLTPVTYGEPGGVRAILESLADRFGWDRHSDADHVTALSRDGATVSLEPGCQVELATPPLRTVGEIAAAYAGFVRELHAVVDPARVVWAAAGVTPVAPAERVEPGPRPRHALMAEYLPDRSPTALAMMRATASTQVAFDFADEADAVRKFRVALTLGPIVNACFANSPQGGRVSHRGWIWQHMDPDRSGPLAGLLARGLSFETYADWLLDVPMLFVVRDGRYGPAGGATFRTYLDRGLDGWFPTQFDWDLHLTTVFPDVRLKTFLEVRGADACPGPLAVGVAAFWAGLLYDDAALSAADAVAAEIPPHDLPELCERAADRGLEAEYRGRPLAAWARDLADLAAAGLPDADRPHLDAVRHVIASGKSPAAARGPAADLSAILRHVSLG